MKSQQVSVTNTIHVWAVPKNPDYDDLSTGPFNFELRDSGSYHWKTGAICVHQQEVTIDVPEGIDLLSKAVETLEAAKVQAEVDFNQRILEIDKQLSQLLMLTHQQSDVIEGELL